ncbi:uncharacterized protein F4807DRAFT_457318 [Annulohypoxylon truncatum]|uniref:uncharacterized protein n=1 Tax=Annulohypoxylon truncatum TaxID=327061 RepID=UPI002007925D|nr:uncharacterized protein F4807DRAFT_457318 [Annulohypoxylon truncatum]KAI1212521.1 hypothetical protein F4807DRAFT_457318 [Annulohypoxylon truncatum]
MKLAKILLARVLFANLLRLVVGTDNSTIPKPPAGPPGCASRCMVDSMFVFQCLDTKCLCNEKDYQKSLFQCLYSQCDSNNYGPALSHAISLCMNLGAEIYMVAPGTVNSELLRSREEDYLAGREVSNLPGMQLRQASLIGSGESGEATTITTMVTAIVTVPYSPITASPTPTAFLETTSAEFTTTSVSRPWVIPVSRGLRAEPSYFGLVVWVCVVLLTDYWVNGYWG